MCMGKSGNLLWFEGIVRNNNDTEGELKMVSTMMWVQDLSPYKLRQLVVLYMQQSFPNYHLPSSVFFPLFSWLFNSPFNSILWVWVWLKFYCFVFEPQWVCFSYTA